MKGCWWMLCLAACARLHGEEIRFEPAAGEEARLASPRLTEASGIAAAIRHPGALWLVNDSGSAPLLHLIERSGGDLGNVEVRGVKNIDWEDLASFALDGEPHLLIADIGDNAAKRDHLTLWIVREPAADAGGKLPRGSVKPAWKIDFRYEDGPSDAESVAIDTARGTILLLSKRCRPPTLHELPLRPPGGGIHTARRLVSLPVDSPAGAFIPFGNQPTAMDISADGSLAAVLTYSGWFLVARQSGETWTGAFRRGVSWQGPHGLPQAEAICFSRDGRSVIVASEGARSKLARFVRAGD